jgi:hypothetical protein
MNDESHEREGFSVDNRPKEFVLSDPEAWQALFVDRAVAEFIVRGFPEGWTSHPLVGGDHKNHPYRAAQHRRKAGKVVALNAPPYSDKYLWYAPLLGNPTHLTSGEHSQLSAEELVSQVNTNTFAMVCDQKLASSLQSGARVVSVEEWRRFAEIYHHNLENRFILSLRKKYFSQIEKRGTREALADDRDAEHFASKSPSSRPPTDTVPKAATALPVVKSHLSKPPKETIRQSVSAPPSTAATSGVSGFQPVRWGPACYPKQSVFDSHFCVVGKPRTGKTTILKLLFQSIYDDLDETVRFVFYDAKLDLLPCMTRPDDLGKVSEETDLPVYLLHPFDERSTAWDIAKDASSRTKAREIANILFPPQPSSNEFFGDASQIIAATVMDALKRKAGDQWTLYDLLTALRPENIAAILTSNPYGKVQYQTYLDNPSTSSSDLLKTLANKTDLLLPAAYAWTKARARLSIKDWVKSQTKSIVLANNEEFEDAVTELNRILLNLLCRQLLAIKPPPARTFVYLDEVEHLGYIAKLKKIGQQGASRQVHMALSLHSLDTLKTVYGQETEGILGDCAFKAFLSVESRNTANWVSETIGTEDVVIDQTSTQTGTTTGQSIGKDSTSQTSSEQKGESVTHIAKTRPMVPANEIMRLPMPSNSQAVTGYFMAPGQLHYKGTLPLSKLICSRNDYLHRRDVLREKDFYALWPEDKSIRETASQPLENIEPPDDSFASLHALGFPKPGYQAETKQTSPSQSSPAQSPADLQADATDSEATPDPTEDSLDDLDFGF